MIKVYKEESKGESVVELSLIEDMAGVRLIAVDKEGSILKNILQINSVGKLYLFTAAEMQGLQTDSRTGKILLEGF